MPTTPPDPLREEHPSPRFEPRDLDTRVLAWVALGLVATLVAIGLGLWGGATLLSWLWVPPGRPPVAPADAPQWVHEVQAREAYERREARALASYGWVDRQAGVVRLPIARALALVASRGHVWSLASPDPWRRQEPPAAHLDPAASVEGRP